VSDLGARVPAFTVPGTVPELAPPPPPTPPPPPLPLPLPPPLTPASLVPVPAPTPVPVPVPAASPVPTPRPAPAPEPEHEAHPAAPPLAQGYQQFAYRAEPVEVSGFYREPEEPEEGPRRARAVDLVPGDRRRQELRAAIPRLSLVLALLAAAAAGVWAFTSRQATGPTPPPAASTVAVDAATAATAVPFPLPAAGTSGRPYQILVAPGWRAQSRLTGPGGPHTDVTLTRPALRLGITVTSAPATVRSVPLRDAVPAGVAAAPVTVPLPGAPAEGLDWTASGTRHRVLEATRGGVRYRLAITVPAASAPQDLVRVGEQLAGLHLPG